MLSAHWDHLKTPRSLSPKYHCFEGYISEVSTSDQPTFAVLLLIISHFR